jgi:hypothetical protein
MAKAVSNNLPAKLKKMGTVVEVGCFTFRKKDYFPK